MGSTQLEIPKRPYHEKAPVMKRFVAHSVLAGSLMATLGINSVAQDSGDKGARVESPRRSVQPRDADDQDVAQPDADVTPLEREVALVRIAELNNQINLAKLAYQKSSDEKVRQFASKWEAIHTANRDRLKRLAASAPEVVVQVAKPALPTRPEPPSRAVSGEPDPGTQPRKGGGTQDPSFGNKPDAGSLDEYNRNTGNPKGDTEEDRAQLRKALSEQSTPGGLEKKRDVEKKASEIDLKKSEDRPQSDWLAIQQKVSAKRLVTLRGALAELGGTEFDESYLRLVVLSHEQMADEDEVFVDYVTSPRRSMLIESQHTATEGAAQAKTMLKELSTGKKAL